MSELQSGWRLVVVTFSLSLGIFMNVLDISIANVAIPNIAGSLGVSPSESTWVITSFAVSQSIMLPITGWLSRRFGEVRLFLFSTVLFSLTSVMCGLSVNLPMLIAFRVLQGVASGPMIPLSQSLLLSIYPEEKHGFATGLWAMVAVVAPIAGPILGGWITDNYTWSWIFYINLPVGLCAAIVTGIILSTKAQNVTKHKIDIMGLVLLIIAVGCLQILLDKGNEMDWFDSNLICALAITSFISFCFLLAWEITEQYPIIDLSLFFNRNFLIGTTALSFGFMVYFSNVVILPLWLQTQMGYTPTWAGLTTAPVGIIPFFLTPFIGLFMFKMDLRLLISIGFIFFAGTSLWASHFDTQVGYWQLVQPRFFQGLGLTCFFTPLIIVILSQVKKTETASALGLANFFRIIGGSFGTSLSITLWDRRETFHQSRLTESINLYNPSTIKLYNHLKQFGLSSKQSIASIESMIKHQAYMLATNDIFWLSGVIFIVLLAIIWFAKPPFQQGNDPVAQEMG